MPQIMIMKLDQGYLVQQSILSKWEPLAALSNGRDLCEWIAKWSGAKVDIFEHYEPANPDADKLTEADIDQLTDEINAEVAAQEPQGSDPEPETAEAPDGHESGLTVIQRRIIDHLEKCQNKHGARFQIEQRTLAEKAGVPKGSIHWQIKQLENRGLIAVERPGPGVSPFFTVTEAGMQVAA